MTSSRASTLRLAAVGTTLSLRVSSGGFSTLIRREKRIGRMEQPISLEGSLERSFRRPQIREAGLPLSKADGAAWDQEEDWAVVSLRSVCTHSSRC